MATSLALQLKQLAAPQTRRLQQEYTVAASLLFGPREASSLERDTFYSIGLTGLEELELLLPELGNFRATLFSESSKMLERSVQTAEANDKLSKEIDTFLCMVTPFMLLKPALKALEWLVNRFQIHLYDADSLMKCILPYHETNAFVKIVQLLELSKENGRWYWLLPVQKAGIPLAKSTLHNHCASDNGFLKFVCGIAKQASKNATLRQRGLQRMAMLFYATTVIGALESAKKVREETLAAILPYLVTGLGSDLEDYVTSSYMLFTYLAQKMLIVPSMVHNLFLVMLKSAPESLASEAAQCLQVVMEAQKMDDLPVDCMNLLVKPGMKAVIAELSQRCDLSRLTQLILKALINAAMNCSLAVKVKGGKSKGTAAHHKKSVEACNFLRSVLMGDADVTFAIRTLLTNHLHMIQEAKHVVNPKLQDFSNKLLVLLEKRYPIAFDQSIEDVVGKLGPKAQKLVQSLLCHGDSKPVPEHFKGSSLLTSLLHPNFLRRQMAVKTLDAKWETLGLSNEKLAELVIARLKDSSIVVVDAIIHSKNLLGRLPPDALIPVLLKIATKDSLKEEWLKVRISAMKALNNFQACSDENADLQFASILPLMFPASSKGLSLARVAASSNLLRAHPVYGAIWNGLAKSILKECEVADLAKFHSQLLGCVIEGILSLSREQRVDLMKHMLADGHFYPKYIHFDLVLLPLLVGEVLGKSSANDQEVDLAHNALEFVATRMNAALKNAKAEVDWTVILSQGSSLRFLQSVPYTKDNKGIKALSLASLGFCLAKVVLGMANAKAASFHGSFFKLVTDWMHRQDVSSRQPFQELLHFWIKKSFADEKSWFEFLLFMLAENSELGKNSPVIQIRCLRLLTTTVATMAVPMDVETGQLPDVLPFALAFCNSQSENVRRVALDCLASLVSGELVHLPMRRLAKKVLSSRDEILCDGDMLNIVLENVLSSKKKGNADVTRSITSTILEWIIDGLIPDVIKDQLLGCLKRAASSDILGRLLPHLDAIVRVDESEFSINKHSIACQILRLLTPISALVFEALPSATSIFRTSLECSRTVPHHSLPSVQKVALQQMTKAVFRAAPSAQQDFLKMLIDLQVNSSDSEVIRITGKVLRKLPFNGEQALTELKAGINSFAVLKSVKEVKGQLRNPKKIVSELPQGEKTAADTLEDPSRRRLLVILEAIQSKRRFRDAACLIPVLFAYLKRSLESEAESDYDKQLLLMCLLKCCDQLADVGDEGGSGQNQFNIELVVKCIRTTSIPRIHHHSLLLLASISKLFPEYVLHNAMAIFTFMGANVFRHDDSYSFNVITRTVESIIPPILETRRHSGDSQDEKKLITSLTRIFVDALPDIPEHRRIPLFKCFIASLEDNSYLWLIVAVILQSYATWDTRSESGKKATGDKRSILDFARHFCHQYLPDDQIAACNRLIGHIILVADSEGDEACEDEMYLQLHSLKQRHHYLLLVVEFAASLLGSEDFLRQVVEMAAEAGGACQKLYEVLLRRTLECVQHFGKCAKASAATNASAVKYWKLVVHRTYELLDRSTSLVPEVMFIDVIKALVNDASRSLQCKAIEMLVAKLQRIGAEPSKVEPFVEIVPDFLAIIKETAAEETGSDVTQQIVNKQMVFLAFKHLSRLVANNHPEAFKEVLLVTMDLLCHKSMHEHLYSSALLCLAELCQTLQVHVIVHLPRIMPAIMTISEDVDKISKNELLLLSVVTAIHRVVESLPHFISPYLHSILLKVCQLSTVCPDNPKSPLATRLKSIRQNLAQEVSLRILLPAIQSCYDLCAEDERGTIQPLMQTLSEAIKFADKNVSVWHEVLLGFFLKALDYRTTHPRESAESIAAVEECVAEPLTVLVIKMSEASFRPFFIKLFDWATREGTDRSRALVFYFMADKIADRLKSLFILFAGHFIRNAATLLDENNTSKEGVETIDENCKATSFLLVRHILDCLHKCFLYDNEGFVNKERFETLLEPLVDQIENGIDTENYSDHISLHLSPCVAQFAVAASNDMLWKNLSYKVLLKTRHSSPKVRFAALQMIQELARKLGEEFVTLLPETIPFLAELMEDESVEVEQLCQSVIADMEIILGEPLQKYFVS